MTDPITIECPACGGKGRDRFYTDCPTCDRSGRLEVEGYTITEDNIEEVAEWCGGFWGYDEKDMSSLEEDSFKVVILLSEGKTEAWEGQTIIKVGDTYRVKEEKSE